MPVPMIMRVEPARGPTTGGQHVQIAGDGFSPRVEVWFGEVRAGVFEVATVGPTSTVDVHAPEHPAGYVNVTVRNLGLDGAPDELEVAVMPAGYRYQSASEPPSTLTRLARAVVQSLKQHVFENVRYGVSIDHVEPRGVGELEAIPIAKVPSIVVSGPHLKRNQLYRRPQGEDVEVPGADQLEFWRHSMPTPFDVGFQLTCTGRGVTQFLELQAAVIAYFARMRWLSIPRDPDVPGAGSVRWPLHADGDPRPGPPTSDGVRAFVMDCVVRGVDLDEGTIIARLRVVDELDVQTERLRGAP